MMCDDLINLLISAKPNIVGRKGAQHCADMEKILSNAQRFVLSPLCVQTIDDLAKVPKAVERTRDYLFTPAEKTWIEWHEGDAGHIKSNRHGLLLIGFEEASGKLSTSVGYGYYIFDYFFENQNKKILLTPSIVWDLHTGKICMEDASACDAYKEAITKSGIPDSVLNEINYDKLGVWLGAALALINTPRLSQRTLHDHSKINKAREARKKPALLSWHDVHLNIDNGELGNPSAATRTGEKSLHHVRTHLRLKNGHIEKVRPHWRGNALKGVVLQRHVVRRVEDENGDWIGGSLPFPKIIKEFKND